MRDSIKKGEKTMFRSKRIAYLCLGAILIIIACQTLAPVPEQQFTSTEAPVETEPPAATEPPVPAMTDTSVPLPSDTPESISVPTETPTSESIPLPSTATVVEITRDNFADEVLQSPEPVLIYFWAAWSGPSRLIKPAVEEIADEYAGRVKVGEVNVDDYQDLVDQYSVQQLPTFVVVNNGSEQARIEGVTSKEKIIEMLDQQLANSP
jgi:thioredoxin 1